MQIKELISLKPSEQERWLRERISDFDQLPFDGEPVGYIIHCDDERLNDYINYPEDYETGSLIKSAYSQLSSERENEINSGSKITSIEKKHLKSAVLEILSNDEFEGLTYTISGVDIEEHKVFATFSCQFIPHPDYTFVRLHETEKEAIDTIKTLSNDEYFFPM